MRRPTVRQISPMSLTEKPKYSDSAGHHSIEALASNNPIPTDRDALPARHYTYFLRQRRNPGKSPGGNVAQLACDASVKSVLGRARIPFRVRHARVETLGPRTFTHTNLPDSIVLLLPLTPQPASL